MNILEEANHIINGPRRDAYGDVRDSFTKVAVMWFVVFGCPVTPQQVAQAMIAFKLCREVNKASFDNRVDLIGYGALLDRLHELVDNASSVS